MDVKHDFANHSIAHSAAEQGNRATASAGGGGVEIVIALSDTVEGLFFELRIVDCFSVLGQDECVFSLPHGHGSTSLAERQIHKSVMADHGIAV